LGWISSEATCDICDGGYFGSNCEACPNCGPHGTCDDGISISFSFFFSSSPNTLWNLIE